MVKLRDVSLTEISEGLTVSDTSLMSRLQVSLWPGGLHLSPVSLQRLTLSTANTASLTPILRCMNFTSRRYGQSCHWKHCQKQSFAFICTKLVQKLGTVRVLGCLWLSRARRTMLRAKIKTFSTETRAVDCSLFAACSKSKHGFARFVCHQEFCLLAFLSLPS